MVGIGGCALTQIAELRRRRRSAPGERSLAYTTWQAVQPLAR